MQAMEHEDAWNAAIEAEAAKNGTGLAVLQAGITEAGGAVAAGGA